MNAMTRSLLADAARAVRTKKYEVDPVRGLLIPATKAYVGGLFEARYMAPGAGEFGPAHLAPNRFVGQGLNKLLNLLGGHVSANTLYLAPFEGDVVPDDTWTDANFVANADEFTAYTPGTRVPWTTVATSDKLLTNVAALAAATITFTAGGPYTLTGCALIGSSAKGAGTGGLVVAARFDDDISGMNVGGKLALQYGLGAIDESDA